VDEGPNPLNRNKDIIQAHAKDVGISGIAVYSCLAHFADANQTCFPSQGYIASLLGCSRAAVNRAIKTLEAVKLIRIEKRAGYPQRYCLLNTSCNSQLQGVSNKVTGGVTHSYTNNNYITRNNNDKTVLKELVHNKGHSDSDGLKPVIGNEPLAMEIAQSLGDQSNLHLYLFYCRKYPESLLRGVLHEVLEVPHEKIKKNRAALFIHRIKSYEKPQ